MCLPEGRLISIVYTFISKALDLIRSMCKDWGSISSPLSAYVAYNTLKKKRKKEEKEEERKKEEKEEEEKG